MSTSPAPVPPPAPAPDPAAAPVKALSSLRAYSVSGVIRVVGYGLIATFACDFPQIVYDYLQRPLDSAGDAGLVTQTIGRVSVPLIGFGLIFGWAAPDAPRWDRVLRKFLSYWMLISAIGCLILSGVAVSAGFRQYRRASAEVDFRANQRTGALARLGHNLTALNSEQLATTYTTLVKPAPGTPAPSPEAMRQQIAAVIPATIDGINLAAQGAHTEGKIREVISTGRFIGDGLIAAVVFFILWEASHSARAYRVFRPRNAPGLGVETAVIGGFARFSRKMERIRLLPNWEDYGWYRRIRRRWRHRKDKHRH